MWALRTMALAAALVGGSEVLAEDLSTRLDTMDCPVVVPVGYCPENEDDFCSAYNCNTNVTNCGWFGCGFKVYCGTPMG